MSLIISGLELPIYYWAVDGHSDWVPYYLPSGYVYTSESNVISLCNLHFHATGSTFYWPYPIYHNQQSWIFDDQQSYVYTGGQLPSGTQIVGHRYYRNIASTTNSGATWVSIGTFFKVEPIGTGEGQYFNGGLPQSWASGLLTSNYQG